VFRALITATIPLDAAHTAAAPPKVRMPVPPALTSERIRSRTICVTCGGATAAICWSSASMLFGSMTRLASEITKSTNGKRARMAKNTTAPAVSDTLSRFHSSFSARKNSFQPIP
jgi:hypothetical protein